MRKILVIGMSDNIGGVETFFHNYYRCFDLKKYHFDFVTVCSTVAFADEYIKNGSKIYNLPNFMKNPIDYYRKMRRIIRNGGYDIIHINMLSAANILPVEAALKEKVPKIIIHSHNTNMPKGFYRRMLHYINRGKLKKSGLVRLACGKSAGEWLFGKEINFSIINNAVSVDRYKFNMDNRERIRRKYNIFDDDFLLGNVGRICEQKNQLFLVDLFKRIKGDDIKLMIIGDGNKQKMLKEKVHALKLENKIIFLPAVENVNEYYSAFDAFILPSKFEGMPVVLVEAQMNGLNSIISDNISDFPDGGKVKILSLDNPDVWVEQIRDLKNNTSHRNYCNPAVIDEYDILSQYKKLLNIYDEKNRSVK